MSSRIIDPFVRRTTNSYSVRRTFRIWDDNRDRKLSFEEFTKGLRDYGVNLSPAEVQRLFASLDRDGNGNIEFDELLIALRVS